MARLCAVCGHSEFVHKAMSADHVFVPGRRSSEAEVS
jgi:hypothetical protein